MRGILCTTFLLLAINCASAAVTAQCSTPSFSWTQKKAAIKQAEEKGGVFVVLSGEGWYVANPAYAASGVPFVANGRIGGYSCTIAAARSDKGNRKAEVLDQYGNVLASFDGKTGDRELPRLLENKQEVITKFRADMKTCLARGKAEATKNPDQAKKVLAPLAAFKGWPEALEAQALIAQL